MADGDEKLSDDERVWVLNRISDAPTEAMWNGFPLVWTAGQVRSIQAERAKHYVKKSVIHEDPTFRDPSIYALVIVDENKQPVEPGTFADPMTDAERKELSKFGTLNTKNLSPDRIVGGYMLADADGNAPTRLELRGAPKENRTAPPAEHI